jgi:sRNA-binding carbon storage regulator CsrA
VLVFSLKRGDAFYVGGRRVELVEFDQDGADLLAEGEEFRCGNQLSELFPDVQVSAGERREHAVRIAVEAPLEIKVLREKLYLKTQKSQARPKPKKIYTRAIGCSFCQGSMTWCVDGRDVPCPAAQNPALPLCCDRVE